MALQCTHATQISTDEAVVMDEDPAPASRHPIFNPGQHLRNRLFSNNRRILPSSTGIYIQEQADLGTPHHSQKGQLPMEVDTPQSTSRLHINALPVELLCEIFAQYTHSFADGAPFLPETTVTRHRLSKRDPQQIRAGRIGTHRTSSTNPILLGHVCQYWRALSLSMPELWSRICVAFPTTSDYCLLHMWLERSGTHPIDLTIVHSEGRYPNDGIVHALRILLDEEHRWKHLSLTLGEGVDRLFEQSTVSCTFPLLETLDIELRDWNEDMAGKFCRRMHGASNLTRLRQDSFWKRVSITPSIPWSVLQDVELNALETRELNVAFFQGLRLQRLVLHHVMGTVDRSSPTPLTLPCLRTLGLGSIEDVSQILRMVSLPALHELHLLSGIGWPCTTRAAHDVLQEIERFGCRLEKLALNLGRNADEDILITILQSPVMVHLKALAVRSKTTSRLLQFLTASSSSPLALPHRPLELRGGSARRSEQLSLLSQ